MRYQRRCIAVLQEVSPTSSLYYRRLTEIGAEMGLELRLLPKIQNYGSRDDWKHAWASAEQLLRTADAFILDNFRITGVPSLVDRFHERIDGEPERLS